MCVAVKCAGLVLVVYLCPVYLGLDQGVQSLPDDKQHVLTTFSAFLLYEVTFSRAMAAIVELEFRGQQHVSVHSGCTAPHTLQSGLSLSHTPRPV